MTFQTAKAILELAERRLLNAIEAPQPIAWCMRKFWYPLKYLAHGLDFFIDNVGKTLVYCMLFPALAAIFSTKFGASEAQIKVNTGCALLGAIFLVLFSLPSTFAHYGVQDSYLQYLVKSIQERLSSKTELDILRDNLESMEKCVEARIKTLRWAMATIWGAVLFGYSQSMAFFTKIATHDQLGELLTGSISFFLVVGFFGGIPLAAIAGYRRTNNLVFRGLEFACREVAFRIESEADRQSPSHEDLATA